MNIRLQYTTQLKAALGVAEEQIEIADGATIDDLLIDLRRRHPQITEEFVVDSAGNLLPSIFVCVNGQQVDATTRDELPDHATVTLLSAISGG